MRETFFCKIAFPLESFCYRKSDFQRMWGTEQSASSSLNHREPSDVCVLRIAKRLQQKFQSAAASCQKSLSQSKRTPTEISISGSHQSEVTFAIAKGLQQKFQSAAASCQKSLSQSKRTPTEISISGSQLSEVTFAKQKDSDRNPTTDKLSFLGNKRGTSYS